MLTTLALSLLLAAPPTTVFISPGEAATLLNDSGALSLDARGSRADNPYIAGAVVINWMSFRDGLFRTGRLDHDLESVRARLEKLGVSDERAVIVYGEMQNGWGDEGRIWWMLRYLGHPRVFIVDGGIQSWIALGLPTADEPAKASRVGPFRFRAQAGLRADWRKVEALRKRADGLILDARTKEEFDGATPYFASRGGHIPGAKQLYWTDLIGKNGRVLSTPVIQRRLATLGANRDTSIIPYCTGGVRSAFLQAILMHAGFRQVANYDGSWWDWAARGELPVAR